LLAQITQISRKFSNIGIDSSKDLDLLYKVRCRLINYIYLFVVFIASYLFVFRLFRGEFFFAFVNVGLIVLLLGSFYFCYKSKHETALVLLLHYFLVIAVLVINKNMDTSIIIYLSLVPCINVFSMQNKFIKYYYFILCIVIFMTIYWGNWNSMITYTSMSLCGFSCCMLFNRILEKIYLKLKESNIEKEKALSSLNDKNEELTLFSNIMVHDLKSPINTIQGFAQVLEMQEKEQEKKECLNYILKSTEAQKQLIDDLLSYSKFNQIRELSLKKICLKSLIEEQLELFSYDLKTKKFIIEIEELPKITADLNSLKTVFQNLISNAIKFQPKEIAHIPILKFYAESDDTFINIYVKDNGIGIDESFVKYLFTPFKKLHSKSVYKGSGLGMSLCKKVMEKHNGEIEVYATSNKGTCFRLSFPK